MNKAFLRLVAEDIHQRFGDEISDIAIVFNNKRPITYLKKHLVDVYQKAIWSPQFFTIQEFFSRSTDKTIASAISQFFYLFNLHNDLLISEGLQPESLEEFYPIAEIILSDFNQLDFELVNIDQVFLELYETTEIELTFQHFTPEQQQYIREFWQSFSSEGHTAIQKRFLRLWRRLPTLYRQFKSKLNEQGQTNFASIYRNLAERNDSAILKDFKQVIFVGFNALNKAEAGLFRFWQEQGKAIFYFDADEHYMQDRMQEAGLFIRRNVHQIGLINALGDFPNIIASRRDDIHCYQCLGKVSETKLLHDLLVRNQDEGKSAAVLLADESLLVPLLQSLPDIPVNITTGYPLTQSTIYGLLDLWMNVHFQISHQKKQKITYQMLETYLSHPLVKMDKDLKQKIQQESAEKQLFEIELADIDISKSALPDFFQRLISADQVIPSLISLLERLLESLPEHDRIRHIESNLVIETRKVLNQLHLGLSSLGKLNIGFQLGLIRKAISPISSAIEGDPLVGLQIMGLLESRCLNFDRIYILGANEGTLPKTSNSATFIPNNLRKAYGLPVLENQDALSAYLFYRHFQYSEDIHVFFDGVISENSSGEESRFLKQIEFETQFNIIKYIQRQPLQFPKRVKELSIEKTGQVWEKLFSSYITKGRKISASAFTTYLDSPLKFFLKYVADIPEPPIINQEFESNRMGTVIHESMLELLSPFKNSEDFISTQEFKKLLGIVDLVVLKQIGIEFQTEINTENDLNSLQRILYTIACEYVKMYLDHDINEYKAIRIIELENSKDYTLKFPITIDNKEQQVTLFGIIDRIDEVINKDGQCIQRIVDYKTGGDQVEFTHIKKVFSSKMENKALLQTLFYTYIYEQVSGLRNLEPHLYTARHMREDGTVFYQKRGKAKLTESALAEQKLVFVDFLRSTLEELFNPEIPFAHNPDSAAYFSDSLELFYRYSLKENIEENESLE